MKIDILLEDYRRMYEDTLGSEAGSKGNKTANREVCDALVKTAGGRRNPEKQLWFIN